MENASKALLIAAGVLIGIMVLSVGVYLFSDFSNTSSQISKTIYDNQLEQFNSQFTKYLGRTDITAHDIVTVCNLARDNNRKYYGEDWEEDISIGDIEVVAERFPYYVSVNFDDVSGSRGLKYSEDTSFIHKEQIERYPNYYQSFLKFNDVEYISGENIKVTYICKNLEYYSSTGRIRRIIFSSN